LVKANLPEFTLRFEVRRVLGIICVLRLYLHPGLPVLRQSLRGAAATHTVVEIEIVFLEKYY
jgi:hypothetical protein